MVTTSAASAVARPTSEDLFPDRFDVGAAAVMAVSSLGGGFTYVYLTYV